MEHDNEEALVAQEARFLRFELFLGNRPRLPQRSEVLELVDGIPLLRINRRYDVAVRKRRFPEGDLALGDSCIEGKSTGRAAACLIPGYSEQSHGGVYEKPDAGKHSYDDVEDMVQALGLKVPMGLTCRAVLLPGNRRGPIRAVPIALARPLRVWIPACGCGSATGLDRSSRSAFLCGHGRPPTASFSNTAVARAGTLNPA